MKALWYIKQLFTLTYVVWYIKQLFPLTYVSTYREGEGRKLSIWRMWFGRCFAIRTYKLA